MADAKRGVIRMLAYFEWSDGNEEEEDRVGLVLCTDEFGQVKPGNKGPVGVCWYDTVLASKVIDYDDYRTYYFTDDFGRPSVVEYDGESLWEKNGVSLLDGQEASKYIPRGADGRAVVMLHGKAIVRSTSKITGKTCGVNKYGKLSNWGKVFKIVRVIRQPSKGSDGLVEVVF